VMIFAGVWLIAKFHWLLYVFGAFLLITGIKMWWFAEEKPDLAQNPVVKWIRGHMNVTDELHGERFFVTKQVMGKAVRFATPLFLVLVLVEITDLIFAVDSIPAIFAITTDPFIVLTSNVFAILGLRAMYFLLADMADRFSLLKYGRRADVCRRKNDADRHLQDTRAGVAGHGRRHHHCFDYSVAAQGCAAAHCRRRARDMNRAIGGATAVWIFTAGVIWLGASRVCPVGAQR
jgi:hypothetical protein